MPATATERADTEEFLTVKEIARRWRVSPAYVYGLIKVGTLVSYELGRSKRIHRDDLHSYEQSAKAGKV